MRKAISVIILLQVCIVFVLLTLLFKKSFDNRFLSISKIDVAGITDDRSSSLNHYYELNRSSTVEQDPPWLKRSVKQVITSQGFNDRFLYEERKPKDALRIVAIGDSFTYGMYVNTKESYPEQLEEMLRNDTCNGQSDIQVINAGIPGYDAEYVLTNYNRNLVQFDPDLVIWFVAEGFSKVNEKIIPAVKECQDEYPERFDSIIQDNGSVQHVCGEIGANKIGLSQREIINYQIERVDELVNQKKDWIIVLDPRKLAKEPYVGEYFQRISEKNSSIHIHNTALNFTPGNEHTLLDGHPNPKGHQALAKEIVDYLLEENLLGCNVEL